MSNHAYAHIDNQFVGLVPTATDRDDSPSEASQPAAKTTKEYIDEFRALPLRSDYHTYLGVRVRHHRSHAPLFDHDFFKYMIEASGLLTSKTKNGLTRWQWSVLSLALIFLLGGGYFSLAGFRYFNAAKDQAASLTKLANSLNNDTADANRSSSGLSTTPVSASALANYRVAANLPRYLIIPKLGVDARVLSVGVTSKGALGTPNNIYDTAWYNDSAQPGKPGAMLIDGHVSSWTAHGVFYGIKNLAAGDTIQVERGDGTIFTYRVVRSQVYPSGNVNMQAAITPVVSSQPGLNLITCTGDVIPGTNNFNERIVVFATQVSS